MKILYRRKIVETCGKYTISLYSDYWYYGEPPSSTTLTFSDFDEAYSYIEDRSHFRVPGIYAYQTFFRHRKYIAVRKHDFSDCYFHIYKKDFHSFSYNETYPEVKLQSYHTIETLQRQLSATDFVAWYQDHVGTICPHDLS